jgi:hypothetical protein
MAEETKRKRLEGLMSQLVSERSSFIEHWRELGDYIRPRRTRFFSGDANRGDRRNQKIINCTATFASRTLRSGMMSGITSPARPWFRLGTPDPALSELGPVKDWLYWVTQRMTDVFLKSNLYNALPNIYGDLGTFGTSAMLVEEDFKNIVRFYVFPIGSFMIGLDNTLRPAVFGREFQMTVRQIVQKFVTVDSKGNRDWTNVSDSVKTSFENGRMEEWVGVRHVIAPNDDYDPSKLASKFKKYTSCYWEDGASGDKLLRESGYDFFPVLCPRWETSGEDVYGTDCPGMTALGDIKQLQTGEKRSAQAIEKMVNPPMSAPSALKSVRASVLPGEVTYHDVQQGQLGFRPTYEVEPRVQELEGKQRQIEDRIRKAFFEDLFLMLANDDRSGVTATEVQERHEEKLLALGPVLEQLNQDLLDPLIDITFQIMLRQGFIPTPPEELQGQDIKVEYISVMAQAQKLVGVSGLERFAGFVGNLIKVSPEVMDKVDLDQTVDVYGDMTSVPPGVVRPDDKVIEIRTKRAKAQEAQAQSEAAMSEARAAKDLSGAKLDGNNALSEILRQAQAGQLVPQ